MHTHLYLNPLRRRSLAPRLARGDAALRSPLLACATLCVATIAGAAEPAPLRVTDHRGVVAADTPDAARAGAEILHQGGSAVDAAIAVALALGVVAPTGSGLGGGGFAVVWDAKAHKAQVLDFREVAPRAATRDMFANEPAGDKLHPTRSVAGGLAVGVPGEPAGLVALHDKFGKLPLSKIVMPAARLAREGFYPTQHTVDVARELGPIMPTDEPMRAWLLPNGAPIGPASRIVRKKLADTLVRFGKGGHDAFYKGPIADDLLAAIRAHGGAMTSEDLASYAPIWREPLVGQFRGRAIYAAPPPAGGATALEALQFLDALPALPKGSLGSSAYFHRVIEALSHAFADRARWMGDPAFFEVPVEKLTSREYARSLAAKFREDGVLPRDEYGSPAGKGAVEPPHDHGTTHLCVVDREGNAVALTTTVNLEFGARFEGPRSGVVLNDQMDDFAARPGKPNGFGLVGAEANSIAPGKRPTSSMTPMIIVDQGNAVMCVGGSGGPTIVASSVQAVVAAFDEDADAETAVGTPRVYAQWRPDFVTVERDVPNDVADNLVKRGHLIKRMPVGSFAPAVQVILRRGDTLEAASDPRKGGIPAAE